MNPGKQIAWMVSMIFFGLVGEAEVFSQSDPSATPPAARTLVVVAPAQFHEALGDYVQHKRRQLAVRLVMLETILRDGGGADDPERLKRHLYGLWKHDSAGYVLLVGDADICPVRYMVLDRITPAAFDYSFYPSDLYYADLAKPDGAFESWNGRTESFHGGYYGEVRGEKNKDDPINYDGIDYLPEVAVGRWPVSTGAEVKIVADKTMRYENGILAGDKPHARRMALISVGGWVDSRPALDRMAARLGADWTIEKRYFSDEKQRIETAPPTAAEVVALMNEGLGVICHAGHGEDLRWDQSFALADLKRVHNADCLPIIFSAGCSTARFATLPPYEPYVDSAGTEHPGTNHGQVFGEPPPPPAPYQKGKYNPPGLGEALIRSGPDGAVAYMGCNTGSQPCGLTLMAGFVSGLKRDRLGDAWNQAIAYYHAREKLATLEPSPDWYPPSIFFQGMKFMLFGDPSLLLPGAENP